MTEFNLALPKVSTVTINPNNPVFYSYDLVALSLAPMQELAGYSITERVFKKLQAQSANGSILDRLAQKGETEYVANLTDYAKKKLAEGEWVFGTKKKTGQLYGTLRDKHGHFISQVELSPREAKELGELETLSAIQSQLHEISKQLEELSHQVIRVEQGQYNDRYAGFFTSRQLLVEACLSNNEHLKQDLLLSAIKTAHETQSKVMLALHLDANELVSPKIRSKEAQRLTSRIKQSMAYLNASVQLTLIAYTTLGEQGALLACLNNYKAFMEQVFLSQREEDLRHLAAQMDNFSPQNQAFMTQSVAQLTSTIMDLINQTTHLYLEEEINDTK